MKVTPQLTIAAGERFSVLGAARSGLAAARALAELGADVLLSDLRSAEDLADALAGMPAGVEFRGGGNHVREGDRVIISPGIRPGSPTFLMAHEKGSEVWSDVELFWRLSPAPILAITGTDGKSTTTALLGEIVAASGRHVFVGGNIGIPLMGGLADLTADSVVVAEVSCFQLVHCPTIRPRVAAFTNIAVDHVDYHGSFEAYQEAKMRLCLNMTEEDTVVWNGDDPEMSAWPWPLEPQRFAFSRRPGSGQGAPAPGMRVENGVVVAELPGQVPLALIPADEIRIPGPHNLENAMLAAGAALAFGIEPDVIRETLRTFGGLEHRIEYVDEVDGVTFYNDSKATNPHAALAGLTAFGERPMVAIVGGSEKGSNFDRVGLTLAERARGVVLVGATGPRIGAVIPDDAGPEGEPTVVSASDFDEAVARAHELAGGEGVVTLCPACASFDMFDDFEHRGREFKAAVARLRARLEARFRARQEGQGEG